MCDLQLIEITTTYFAAKFNQELVCLLRQMVNCSTTKLKHLTVSRPGRRFWDRINDRMGKEIIQLLTQITTNTSIKSLFIYPLQLKAEYNDFLRMWYCQPFGDCNIPQILDINPSRIPVTVCARTRKIMRCTSKSIYVTQFCDKKEDK